MFLLIFFVIDYVFRIWTAKYQYPAFPEGKAILKELGIEFEYVTHSPAFTIEECLEIEKKIDGTRKAGIDVKDIFLMTVDRRGKTTIVKKEGKK